MCLIQVLLWIKQWDSCVFGSHIRATSGDVLSALRRHSSTIQKNSSNRNFFSKGKGGTVTREDNMPLNASNGNAEGSVSSFSKKPSIDNAPEQKVGLFFRIVLMSITTRCIYYKAIKYSPYVSGAATVWSTWTREDNSCSRRSQTLWLPRYGGLCYDHAW